MQTKNPILFQTLTRVGKPGQNTVFPLDHGPVRALFGLVISLAVIFPATVNVDKSRENAVKSLAKEIEQAQFHKVYVADFLDPSGARTEKGCFFASSFSTDLAKGAHSFEVVNRIQAQKQLNELHISAQDLQQPELLSKAALALGADSVLVGRVAITPSDVNLLLSLRAASGKEIHSMDYHEQLKPAFENNFPAVEAESSHFYYFPGLDGVSPPKCIYCPDPEYTDEARRSKIQGNVLLSVIIDEKGAITSVRIVKNPDDSLTRKAVNILRKWRMEPSHDMYGNPVPIRVAIEISFKLLR